MEQKRSFGERFRYYLDSVYSSGTGAVIITLGVLSLVLALVGTLVLLITGLAPGNEAPYSPLEAFWVGILSAIGSGGPGRESSWGYRLLMFGMTFGSIFIYGFFLSSLTNGLVSRVSELKRGRSIVVEKDHTVILGWSEQIFTIISELVEANAGRKSYCIAILGGADKSEMEEQIIEKVKNLGRTRIVCRSGDPMEMADLNIVSLNTSEKIIILPPDSSYPDADVIKTVLAITQNPDRRKKPYDIVAGLRNSRYFDVAQVAGKGEVEWVMIYDTVSRLIAQTSLQPGLSTVYDDLFVFAGNEIYFKSEPRLSGKTFGEGRLFIENNSLIGLCTKEGQTVLNPPIGRVIDPDDRLIVIAPDSQPVQINPSPSMYIRDGFITSGLVEFQKPKQILILGWNWRGAKIIQELNHYLADGSEVTVLSDQEKVEEAITKECRILENVKVQYHSGDSDDRQLLEGILLKNFDHLIILAYSDKLPMQRADAKTLVTLLHLRDIKEREGLSFTVVSEMMDIRNYRLASTARADDYIVSDRLTSLYMTQVVENREVSPVFLDLLNAQGSEIYLKPVEWYVQPGKPVNFCTVVEAACRRGESAFGYRIAANAAELAQNFGIVINPLKSSEITFAENDRIIVLAQ